jgi:hypothetical protein
MPDLRTMIDLPLRFELRLLVTRIPRIGLRDGQVPFNDLEIGPSVTGDPRGGFEITIRGRGDSYPGTVSTIRELVRFLSHLPIPKSGIPVSGSVTDPTTSQKREIIFRYLKHPEEIIRFVANDDDLEDLEYQLLSVQEITRAQNTLISSQKPVESEDGSQSNTETVS